MMKWLESPIGCVIIAHGPAPHHHFFGTDGLSRDHTGKPWAVFVWGTGKGADAEDALADGGLLWGGGADVCGDEQSCAHCGAGSGEGIHGGVGF